MTDNATDTKDTGLPRYAQKIAWGVFIAAVFCGVVAVIRYHWVCDDAFISFRYARNLVNGLGLVFNAGEHVEGYTNFLWTIIIAGGMLLKIDPVPLSEILGALSFFATVGLFAYLSWKLFNRDSVGSDLFAPLTATCLLLHHEMAVFATSGLETAWTTALISLGFVLLVRAKNDRAYLLAGLALVAAAMSRPDAMAFCVMACIYVLMAAPTRRSALIHYLAPLLLVYLPYWIIKYAYYGYPFPNTYYAKSANLPYYSQGIVYLWLYVKSYYALFLVPVALAVALATGWKKYLSFPVSSPIYRALLLTILFVFPYLWYVVRSGGDFMFGRFLVPVTPLLFFIVEIALRISIRNLRIWLPIATVIILAVLFRADIYSSEKQIHYVADEPAYYPQTWLAQAQDVGGRMKNYFAGTDVKMAFKGQYAVYAYYSEVPVAIERETGLTDEFIAHQTLTSRGRPGHEKPAPQEYLYGRGIHFDLRGGVSPGRWVDTLCYIRFGDVPAYIYIFDNRVMDRLRQFPEIQFHDVRATIDTLLVLLKTDAVDRILMFYPLIKSYYFDHNVDPARQQPFIDALAASKRVKVKP